MKRILLLSLSSALLAMQAAASSGPGRSVKEWLGGFQMENRWTVLRLHVSGDGAGVSATADVPSLGWVGLAVADLQEGRNAISFRLPVQTGELTFRGGGGEDELTGDVVKGSERGSFQLMRTVQPDQNDLAQDAGAYAWEGNEVAYVQFWSELGNEQLGIFDESGEIRALYPMGKDRFFVGAGIASPAPVEARVVFRRDRQGAVRSLSWEVPGRPPRVAARVTPYSEEEVSFDNGDVRLAGTLLMPSSGGKHPVMVLVHGSGPEDRNSLLPFVRFLARQGMGLLAFDKRGVGGSGGDWRRADFLTLAGDVLAAVRFLRSRDDIDPRFIGVFGVSQGGWIAPLAASRSPDIGFVVSVSGAGVTPAEETLDYVKSEMRVNGVPEEEIAEAVSLILLAYQYGSSGEKWNEYAAARERLGVRAWLPLIGLPARRDDPQWEFMRLIYFYDPAPALRALHCPTLALFGGLDLNVLPEKNAAAWASALRESGNRDVTLRIVPRGNHVLVEAETGSAEEFARLRRFVPDYFVILSKWLRQRIPKLVERSPSRLR